MKKIFYLALLTLGFIGCNRSEPDDFNFILVADREVITAGETVNFTLYHNCETLTAFSGDAGSNYKLSAAYILADATNDDLYNGDIDRVDDPNSYGCVIEMDDYDVGDLKAGGGVSLYYSTDGYNYGTPVEENFTGKDLLAKVTADYDEVYNIENPGDKALMIRNQTQTNIDKYFIHFEPKSPLTNNKKLSLRLRASSNLIYKNGLVAETSEETPNICLYFYVRLNCVLKDGSATKTKWIDNPNSLGSTATKCKYIPSLEYQTVTFDLSKHISNWASANGVDEEDIAYIDFVEFNIKTGDGMTYMDDLFITDISYSGQAYYEYDYGQSLTISNDSGVYHWSHTYDEPGTYEPTFIGKTYGGKNNYDPTLGSATESDYKYNEKIVSKTILVR